MGRCMQTLGSVILISLDNKGMWNLRFAIWERWYLGQELYLRVWNNEQSIYTETVVPPNALFCGKAKHLPKSDSRKGFIVGKFTTKGPFYKLFIKQGPF